MQLSKLGTRKAWVFSGTRSVLKDTWVEDLWYQTTPHQSCAPANLLCLCSRSVPDATKIATRSSKVGYAEKKDTSEDNYQTTLLWFVLKKEIERRWNGASICRISWVLSLICGKVKEFMAFKITSRGLRMVTQNFKVSQIALHSDKEGPVIFNPQDLVFFVLSHT